MVLLIVLFHSLFKVFSLIIRLKVCGLQERQVLNESQPFFEQLLCFCNLLYFIQFRFIGLPENIIQKHKSKAGTMLATMHVKSMTSPHLPLGLTHLIYHLLALFPSSPTTHPLRYLKNMLDENLAKYLYSLAKYICTINICVQKRSRQD